MSLCGWLCWRPKWGLWMYQTDGLTVRSLPPFLTTWVLKTSSWLEHVHCFLCFFMFDGVTLCAEPPPPIPHHANTQGEKTTFRHFISCGLSLKIEPANDGCVGEPAGSPWNKFKQAFSVQSMCVCVCVLVTSWTCVYLAEQVFQRTYGTPIFDPVIPFQNHPQASLKGARLNPRWAAHSEAQSVQKHQELCTGANSLHSSNLKSLHRVCVCSPLYNIS